MSEKVSDLLFMENPTVAPYAKSGEALLRVTAKAQDEEKADELMKDVISEIESRLGDYIYGIDVSGTEEALSILLREKKMTVHRRSLRKKNDRPQRCITDFSLRSNIIQQRNQRKGAFSKR